MLSPDAKLATYVIDDPQVEGVACYFTVPEIGGWSGWAGFAEERSETSLACRQVGPVTLKAKFAQGEEIYRQRRSLFFKKMQIVRGCDAKRNVLVYLATPTRSSRAARRTQPPRFRSCHGGRCRRRNAAILLRRKGPVSQW